MQYFVKSWDPTYASTNGGLYNIELNDWYVIVMNQKDQEIYFVCVVMIKV